MSYEQYRAQMEAERNAACKDYFDARSLLFTDTGEYIFEAAYERGWNERNKKVMELQAKIDALMLEFCPKEMTAEQQAEWEKAIKSLRLQHTNTECVYRPIPNIYRQA